MTNPTSGSEPARAWHGYPCRGPHYAQTAYSLLMRSTDADDSLQRCTECGALWAVTDRSSRRLTAGAAAGLYPGVVIPAFVTPQVEPADAPVASWVHLNQDVAYRIYVEVPRSDHTEIWGVLSRGELRPLPDLDSGPLESISHCRFDDLLLAAHGTRVASTVACAIAWGMHPLVLKALDLVHSFGDEPGAAAGSSITEVAAGLVRPLIEGGALTLEDLRIEGF